VLSWLDSLSLISFGTPCVFPFTYEGVNYTTCTFEDEPFPWCSTNPNGGETFYDDDDQLWGYCDFHANDHCEIGGGIFFPDI